WYKFIEGSTRRQPVQLNERVRQVSGTLIIREARVEDSGKYLCIVNNSVGGESVETVLTVTAPLSAEIEPSTQTIDFGRPATFTCNVKGNPIKTISWLKDGKPLGLEEPVLRIESVKKEDKGMYQCFVRNDQESAQATAELKLGGRFEPPQIRQAFAEETLQPGPSMFLKCVASGNPTPEITWELDGKRLSNTERLQVGQYVTVNGDVVSHLNISSIHTNDGGLYKCIAASKVGFAEHSARLNVYGLPFIRHMDKKAIVAGETLRVTCPVAGYPIESIVWERDTRVLPINRKQKVFPNGTLIIENVERMSDQATYTCVARNAQGYSARGTLEVQVMVPPTIQQFSFTKLPMNAGEFANLQCIVPIGDLPLNIRWSYPGEEMGGSSGVLAKKVADRVSMLMISVITARHAGEYVCTAENAAGTAFYATTLTVNVGPQLLPIAFNAEVANWGDSVSVPCSILKGDMPMDISWAFDGVPIDSSKDASIKITRISRHLSTLSIDGVSARHAGEYACSASNLAGSVSRSTTLTVNVAPQILPFAFGDEPASWGELVSVTCSVAKGDQPLEISWAFNGTPIDARRGSDVVVASTNRKNSVLTIESVAARHAGEYACSASNRAGATTHSAQLNVNVAPQILQFSFGDDPLNSGEMLSVSCTIVKGDFPVKLTWTFDDTPIDSSRQDVNIVNNRRVSFLSIDSVAARHAGRYKCTATNAAGSDSHTAVLSVNVAPVLAPFAFGDEAANAGEMATVQCAVIKGDLPVDIVWSQNGRPIDVDGVSGGRNYGNPDIVLSRSTKRISTLTIESVAARHAGEYSCTASNAAGSATHSSVLSVNVSPRIAPFEMADKAVNWGDSVSAVCTVVNGDSPLEISWALNGMPIEESHRISVTTTKRNSLLSIDSASPSHAGSYTCVVSNAAGATSYSAELTVNVAPQIAPFVIAETPANWGDSISVVCAILKGDLPIEIAWALNGEPIGQDRPDINILATTRKNSILSIESVTARHAGEYACSASNKAGATSHSSTLAVNVAPEIAPFVISENPANWGDTVTATCTMLKGDHPIQIEWAHNGDPISHDYPDITISTSRRVSLLTIDALTASHAGEYTCMASNAAGGTSFSASLAVNVAPEILPFVIGEGPANWGETVTATCTALKGDHPLRIEWALNGEPISRDYSDVSIISTSKRVSVLTIEAITARHAGEYTCTVSNLAGGTSYSASLAVNVAPEIIPFEIGEGPANWGDTVTAICTVLKGDHPIQIDWALNGRPISRDHSDISIVNTSKRVSVLTIDAVTARHVGEYTCTVSNVAGGTSYSADLAVNGTRSAPSLRMHAQFTKGQLFSYPHPPRYTPLRSSGSILRSLSSQWQTPRSGHGTWVEFLIGFKAQGDNVFDTVAPEIVPFVMGERPANWGDTVTATCTVLKGDHPIRIEWALNGEPISRDYSDVSIVATGKRVSLLTIDAATARHAGEYTCTASNAAGGTSYSASLAVNGTVPVRTSSGAFLQSLPSACARRSTCSTAPIPGPDPLPVPRHRGRTRVRSDGPVNWGDMVSATCSIIKGDFPVKIVWQLNGQPIGLHDPDITITKINKHMSALSIESVAARHAGEYTCVATNRAGNVDHSTTLAVNVAPQIFPFSFGDEPVNSGEAISATCSILKGDFPMDISWAFNGVPIDPESTDQFAITKGKRLSVLAIDAVAARHSGEYTCTASNKAGASSHAGTLAVNVAPQIAPFSIGDEPANWGEAVSAVCTIVKGDLPIDVSWALNGEPITRENHGDVSVSSTGKRVSLMTIEAVSARHAGEYTCTASNAAGATSHSASEEPANWGEQISTVCSILKGDSPIEIRWSLNGEPITPRSHPDITIMKNAKKMSVLLIDSVSAHHAGEYSCVASNMVGSVSRSAVLAVNVSPQIAPISFGEEPVNAGDLVSVQCVVTKGDSPLEITWSFDGQPIRSDRMDVLVSNSGKRVKQVTIESVAARHAGEYTCVASNAAGSTSHSAKLDVNVIPKLLSFTFGEEPLNSGQVVTVPCAVIEGDQPLKLRWTLNGHAISPHSGISIVDLGGRGAILSIGSVQAAHAGTYTCIAENLAGRHELSADLIVNGAYDLQRTIPTIVLSFAPHLQPFSFNEANSGDLIIVHCAVVKGDTPISLKWLFEGRHLEVGDGVGITALGDRVSALTIPAVRGKHSGEYACVADNPAGRARHSAHLKVNGTETARTTLSASKID
ncbi:hypothetical protein KM043_002940, partial [Ampulex compressa]